MYKVDKGIKIPAVTNTGRPTKYPLRTMEVGDSFFVPCSEKPRGISDSYSILRKDGLRFTQRKWTENGVKGHRIWRIK